MILIVLEDYIHLLLQMVDFTPDLMFLSPAFPHAFGAVLSSLTLLSSHITFAALDFVRIVVNHDCMIAAVQIRGSAPTTPQPPVPPKFPLYAAAIRQVIDDQGFQLVGLLLTGLVSTLPEDSTSIVVSIFRILAPIWSNEMLAWLPPVMDQIPAATLPVQAKQQFITDFNK
jgi:transportin-3